VAEKLFLLVVLMMAAVGLFGQDVTLAKPQEKAAAFNMGSKVTYNLGGDSHRSRHHRRPFALIRLRWSKFPKKSVWSLATVLHLPSGQRSKWLDRVRKTVCAAFLIAR